MKTLFGIVVGLTMWIALFCGFCCLFLDDTWQYNKTSWNWLTLKFSPKGGCAAQIVKAIQQAKTTILVQAYSFTSKDIINALIEAKKRGVDVQIILDNKTNGPNAQFSGGKACVDAKIPVFVDPVHAIAHNKVIILDSTVVLTGSFNFTSGAENNNAENSVPIFDKDMVKLYINNWKAHLEHSKPWRTVFQKRIKKRKVAKTVMSEMAREQRRKR